MSIVKTIVEALDTDPPDTLSRISAYEYFKALQDIETFGFSEGTGPLGFDYLPRLAEFGGSTPF
jgi:hypothetical protein